MTALNAEPRIIDADLTNAEHATAFRLILNEYAMTPDVSGQPLPDAVLAELPLKLTRVPDCVVLLALLGTEFAGLAVCFPGFSTFAAKPLLNLHDFAVRPRFQGRGVARALLKAIEERARQRGCCRVTLEVTSDNAVAQHVYERQGFRMVQQFWRKEL